MQFFLFILFSALLRSSPVLAAQSWEICLDKADFNFPVDDSFFGSVTALKSGCTIRFAISGGKGEKYEIDLCDPKIHIDYYPAIDASSFRRVLAGSAGCPAPLFGADFEENSKDFNDFKDMRKRVLTHFNTVKEKYGEGMAKVDLSNPSSFSPDKSDAKAACGQFLLQEYLVKCMAFEGKKLDTKDAPAPNIPGVHPQTIFAPKK